MIMKSLKIGDLEIPIPTILAPMAGYSDLPFRKVCRQLECGLVVSELVSSEGIIREAGASLEYLDSDEIEKPVGAQIFGTDAGRMAEVARHIDSLGRFALVDINAGCPVPKLMKKGAGASLMKDPENIATIVRTISSAISLPLTFKTRIGLKTDLPLIREVADAVQSNGAAALTIHGRYAENHHRGDADWELIAEIKQRLQIPVIGNGGIYCAADALKMFTQTAVDGVMIGRAAVGNPWIFKETACLLRGEEFAPPSLKERRTVMLQHLHDLIERFRTSCRRRDQSSKAYEISACRKFRPQMVKYLSGFQGVHKLSANLDKFNTLDEVIAGIDSVLDNKSVR